MTTTKSYRSLAVALTAVTVLAGGAGVAHAQAGADARTTAVAPDPGWAGITRERVRIDFG
ncbi:hypothetical protein [Actinoplanes sp. HUAS TT8]|uniref:hypothetical protein n=1 Tax=Actinoplanes sp. HUAS TT8 TaxID=3447453 RepID=UPI003F51E0A9